MYFYDVLKCFEQNKIFYGHGSKNDKIFLKIYFLNEIKINFELFWHVFANKIFFMVRVMGPEILKIFQKFFF